MQQHRLTKEMGKVCCQIHKGVIIIEYGANWTGDTMSTIGQWRIAPAQRNTILYTRIVTLVQKANE